MEKPLANSVGEINVMLDAARKYNSIVQVGQQQRSGAHWKTAIDFVKSGKLGTIRQVKFWGNFNYGAGNMPVPDSEVLRREWIMTGGWDLLPNDPLIRTASMAPGGCSGIMAVDC